MRVLKSIVGYYCCLLAALTTTQQDLALPVCPSSVSFYPFFPVSTKIRFFSSLFYMYKRRAPFLLVHDTTQYGTNP